MATKPVDPTASTASEYAAGGISRNSTLSRQNPLTIFSQILAGEAAASFVYRDEQCAAFMDIRPINSGHVLVVPLEPASCLAELDEETAAHLMRVGHRIAAAMRRSTLQCEGINLLLADGEAAGQEVFHVHLHVIPRFRGDGFGLRHSPDNQRFRTRQALDQSAEAIREGLNESPE